MGISEQIKSYTALRIDSIVNNPSGSAVRTSLAKLRKGAGHAPGELPELWGEFLLGMPSELYSSGKEPSYAEWAVYTALTVFAIHQQGKPLKEGSMHCSGVSLGAAARKLIKKEDDRERVNRRFYLVAGADNMTEFAYYLRSLITLLRSENIGLDYVQLASDMFYFQNPNTADSVRLRWGEDFCRLDSNIDYIEKEG